MKNPMQYALRLFILSILIIGMPALIACKKESPQPSEKTASQAVNPYSDDSVFIEVKKRLEENPGDVDALYHLADLYDRNAQYAEAIETYRKVIRLKPDMGYAYFKMGTAYDRLNKPDEAVSAFGKAIKYLPDNAMVYNNLGIAYGKLNKLNEEIAALKKAISLRPAYSSARYNLGMAYLKAGNKKAALQEYESLNKFDTGLAGALLKEIKKAS